MDVYVEIKLKQAGALAAKQRCEEARAVIQQLGSDAVPRLSVTKDALVAMQSRRTQREIAKAQAPCKVAGIAPAGVARRLGRIAMSGLGLHEFPCSIPADTPVAL